VLVAYSLWTRPGRRAVTSSSSPARSWALAPSAAFVPTWPAWGVSGSRGSRRRINP